MPNWEHAMMRVLRIQNRPVTVTAVHDYTSWYRRVTFSAPELVDQLAFFPTFWLRLWAEGPSKGTTQRGYTFADPRPDDGTFALDFVLHEEFGPASSWARQARPGQAREIALTPRQKVLPETTRHLVLIGDITALPAINSWVPAAPPGAQITIGIEDDHSDHEHLPRAETASTSWTWIPPEPEGRGSALAAWLSATVTSTPDLYVWGAGEKTLVKTVRNVLRNDLGLERSRHFTQFYWIEGKSFN